MKTSKWYDKRLHDYFYQKYAEYEEGIEWFTNPAINQWKFNILKLGVEVVMTCTDDGVIEEVYCSVDIPLDKIIEVLETAFEGLDALYEDYIVDLVGAPNFKKSRDQKVLLVCWSISGRTLYVMNA